MFKPKVSDWLLILVCVKERRDRSINVSPAVASQLSELYDNIESYLEQSHGVLLKTRLTEKENN